MGTVNYIMTLLKQNPTYAIEYIVVLVARLALYGALLYLLFLMIMALRKYLYGSSSKENCADQKLRQVVQVQQEAAEKPIAYGEEWQDIGK